MSTPANPARSTTTVPRDSPERRLIEALKRPERYPHAVDAVTVIETHISWVLLAGDHAYKIKKPVSLGFADFSTLELRRSFCHEELRLNRRLAPAIYLNVVAIHGKPDNPTFSGTAPVIEYAVKMRRFPDDALARRMLAAGTLTAGHVIQLAARIADFHDRAAVAGQDTSFGEPPAILDPALDSIRHMLGFLPAAAPSEQLLALRTWIEREGDRLAAAFQRRKAAGRVRECHGDLHLGNIALLDGEMSAFDGIEFNDQLRWIDVINEIAFTVMDLTAHGRRDLAILFLNTYLEQTGDYQGLAVLRYYMVYRALVRAKIEVLRAAGTADEGEHRGHVLECHRYLDLAQTSARGGKPALVIMHGLSGSGKTTVAAELMQLLGAVRIRSDIERKRGAGLGALARSRASPGGGLYAPDVTRATYDRLAQLARTVLEEGYPVIVDAAFLLRWQRDGMRALADEMRVPCAIVSLQATETLLRERITERAAAGSDASEADAAVLARQLASHEPLSGEELKLALTIDAGRLLASADWEAVCHDLCSRLTQ